MLLEVVGRFQRALEMSDWIAVAEEVNRRTTTSDNAEHPGRSAADCCRRFVELPLVRQALVDSQTGPLTAATHAASVVQMGKDAVAEEKDARSVVQSQNDEAPNGGPAQQLKLERLAVRKEREILKLSSHLLQEQVRTFPTSLQRFVVRF